MDALADDPRQVRRRRRPQEGVDVLEVLAEQVVEQRVLGAGVVVAVPPEPVATFGDVQLLPGLADLVRRRQGRLRVFAQVLAGAVQRVPGGVVLFVADPDGEVVVDPAAGEQPRQRVAWRVLAQEFADRDGPHARRRRAALVQLAQELHAAAGVVFPAVLAVQDDADQGRLGAVDRLADVVQVPHEILGRGHRLAALVVEADGIAEGVVAEDNGQLALALAHPVGAVHALGVDDVAVAVAADEALRRVAEDLLVGGDPLDAVLDQERNHRLADAALGGPHADRRLAEQVGVLRDRPADVHRGVFGVAAGVARQLALGHRLAGQLLVEQERQDRVEIGRRGQFDLARLGEPAVQRQDLPQDLQVLVEHALLFRLREVAALGEQFAQGRILLEGERVDPGEVEPDLQVPEVAFAEAAQGFAGGVAAGGAALVQLGVARERTDHVVRVRHEEVVEQVEAVLLAQAVGGAA